MVNENLQKKIDRAIKLLKSASYNGGGKIIEVAYSGGKDSDVILQLTKEAGIPYRAIYKNTTIDPPGTVAHAREMGAEVVKPNKTFFQLMTENGNPTRYYRFCCGYLKEYQYDKNMSKTIIGVRKAESKKRESRYKEPTECLGTKKNPYEAIYPLLDWTDDDVDEFIRDRGIKCAPVYYDEEGIFHVERRLGCMCCPLQSKNKRIEEFKKHPRMIRQYVKHLQIYMDNHPDSQFTKLHKGSAFMAIVKNIFHPEMSSKQFDEMFENVLFDKPDYKAILENRFNVNLDF